MCTKTKSMLVGAALATATAVAPVWAADESVDINARADFHALSQMAVESRTELAPLSTEQLDSVEGSGPVANLVCALPVLGPILCPIVGGLGL